jgi:hypothetical protein
MAANPTPQTSPIVTAVARAARRWDHWMVRRDVARATGAVAVIVGGRDQVARGSAGLPVRSW